MPWSQLTGFHLINTTDSGRKCHDILFKCPNLVDCTFITIDMHLDRGLSTPIVLPHLQKLRIGFVGLGNPSYFFQHLTLPGLKDLDLDMTSRSFWSHEIFTEFMTRSSLDLENLRLSAVGMRSSELVQLLRLTPSLVELKIQQLLCIDNWLLMCYAITRRMMTLLFQNSKNCTFPASGIIKSITTSSQA
jgi:hypothetical protein